ncbi:MAG: hypothetical protein ACEPOW_13350 [Bacteroidales bacterium]
MPITGLWMIQDANPGFTNDPGCNPGFMDVYYPITPVESIMQRLMHAHATQ